MSEKMFASVHLLKKGLDAAGLRNQAISHNIANAETPGFKAIKVEFEQAFAAALKQTNGLSQQAAARRLDKVRPRISENRQLAMRLNGNNVDIDAENALLAKNTIYYNTMVQKINAELRKLRLAINEGR